MLTSMKTLSKHLRNSLKYEIFDSMMRWDGAKLKILNTLINHMKLMMTKIGQFQAELMIHQGDNRSESRMIRSDDIET